MLWDIAHTNVPDKLTMYHTVLFLTLPRDQIDTSVGDLTGEDVHHTIQCKSNNISMHAVQLIKQIHKYVAPHIKLYHL